MCFKLGGRVGDSLRQLFSVAWIPLSFPRAERRRAIKSGRSSQSLRVTTWATWTSTCSGRTTITPPSGATIISSMPRPCGRWVCGPDKQDVGRRMSCRERRECSIPDHLCPAPGPGGAGSAQGHHGAAADEPGLVWHWLGHCQEVHLCRLFPPGSQAQGEPGGAWWSCDPFLVWHCPSAESSFLTVQSCRSGLPREAGVRAALRGGGAAQVCSVLLRQPLVGSLP